MSDSQAYEEVTAISDGVTVVKRFEEDEFPVPAIAFEFDSDRDEEVTVRLVDVVPDGVAVEDLGFHPEYGSEYWTIDEDRITFERDLSAGAEYTTVYGIRATGTDDVEQFLTQPELDDVDPPLPDSETEPPAEAAAGDGGDEVIPESDDDVVRDVISGEAEDVPGLENDEEPTDEEVETLDLKDPNEAEAAAGAPETSEGPEEAEEAEETESNDGTEEEEAEEAAAGDGEVDVDLEGSTLVTALAEEIRQNNVSAEDVKLLRQAFEIAGQEGGSVVARIQRLQSDVSDLRAYTDALEEFLDDSGTAQQVIQGFESDINAVEGRLEDMQTELQGNSQEIETVAEDVDSIQEEVQSVGEDVASFESEIDHLEGEVDDVTDDISSVRNEVNGVDSNVEDLQDSIDELESELEEIRGMVSEEDVEGRVDEVEQELEDLQDWQNQIKSTFGG
jgi:predicted  nucleic acid-binding Zn-ribbon protein